MKSILSLAAWTARVLPVPLRRLFYRLGPLTQLIRRVLNRAAPAGLTAVQIAAGELAGLTVLLDLQTEKDYWLGTYEPELQAALRRWVQPGQTIYDVGANIGYMSLLCARCLGSSGQVFAFEALPENVTRLRKNLALNTLEERVTVIAGAVIDHSGEAQFQVHPSNSMGKVSGAAGRGDGFQKQITVPAFALDDFVFGPASSPLNGRENQKHPAPHLIKMDIEGGEVLAIQGMRRVLNECHPLMLVELHGFDSIQVVGGALQAAGYQLYNLDAEGAPVSSLETLDWKAYLLALPK